MISYLITIILVIVLIIFLRNYIASVDNERQCFINYLRAEVKERTDKSDDWVNGFNEALQKMEELEKEIKKDRKLF